MLIALVCCGLFGWSVNGVGAVDEREITSALEFTNPEDGSPLHVIGHEQGREGAPAACVSGKRANETPFYALLANEADVPEPVLPVVERINHTAIELFSVGGEHVKNNGPPSRDGQATSRFHDLRHSSLNTLAQCTTHFGAASAHLFAISSSPARSPSRAGLKTLFPNPRSSNASPT